ncbi:MAG: WbqC family protein [Janthinobacterium svalbardensis]
MKIAIMQPYFFPYIGYFQLIAAVDLFVLYDNIQYTKKGWINRNRILLNGNDTVISLPLKKDNDTLDVRERKLATDFKAGKLLAQLNGAYRKAPYFEQTMLLVESTLLYETENLFTFLHNSLVKTCAHLGIVTPIQISSEIDIDHSLKGQDKVVAICKSAGAQMYINALGGQSLYSAEDFLREGIELRFIRSQAFTYAQFGAPFVPWLSLIDVLMFNSATRIRSAIDNNYELL